MKNFGEFLCMAIGGSYYISLTGQLNEYNGWGMVGFIILAIVIYFIGGTLGIMIQEILSITYSKWKNGGRMNGLKS